MDQTTHPWKKKKLVNLYDLFFFDVIPCTQCITSTRNINCKLAHINDSFENSVNYAYNNQSIIAISKLQFKEWNHNQYLIYLTEKKIKLI